MTRQTVSIAGIKGGVALDERQADRLADFLEALFGPCGPAPDDVPLARIINVLRGKEPGGEGESQ